MSKIINHSKSFDKNIELINGGLEQKASNFLD